MIFSFDIIMMVKEMKHIFILKPDTDHKLVNHIVKVMQGRQYKLCYTKDLNDARSIAQRYQHDQEICRIYAVGGDGFVHQVVNGMISSLNELVIIPAGTGNDLARTIYPYLDPLTILDESLTMSAQPVDVIRCNDSLYCINVFCCGLDAEVGNLVNVKRRNIRYMPRSLHYTLTIIEKIMHLRFYPTVILQNDQELFSGDVVVCAFCNGHYFGGGFKIGYHGQIDDGCIDINVVSDIAKRHLPEYVKALVTGRLHKTKNYQHFSEKDVIVKTSQYVNIDGEMYDPGVYHLTCLHHSLKLVYRKEGSIWK